MANHIENWIIIENGNEEVLSEIKRIFECEEGQYETHTEDLAKRVFGDDTPEEYDREWYCEMCGAKWFHGYIESDDMEEITINITSAWAPINSWLERLSLNLQKIKEDVIIYNQFE